MKHTTPEQKRLRDAALAEIRQRIEWGTGEDCPPLTLLEDGFQGLDGLYYRAIAAAPLDREVAVIAAVGVEPGLPPEVDIIFLERAQLIRAAEAVK